MVLYEAGKLEITKRRRFTEKDPDLVAVHEQWELMLRKGVSSLPEVDFTTFGQKAPS
jgi:putative proteasome-type protease